ncbi:hypothetical protein BZG36_05204 [Bifiguratus adelaidae]|uniref:Uncharacterized protein n=1 Tax=Bifiguratus adelaidae TaxID=1938954 RepID=A0A261XTH4_9FUNG|nr:hypothetical protein BZG36_05204 [Bifiguratus adelaidae]
MAHDASVQRIDQCPVNDNIVLSASQDGTIKLWDFRTGGDDQGTIMTRAEINEVEFHPTMPTAFVSCDARGHVLLRDMRTAFGASYSQDYDAHDNYTQKNFLVQYSATLSKSDRIAHPDISSVTFSPYGQYLVATIARYLPTIYDVFDGKPIGVFGSNEMKAASTPWSVELQANMAELVDDDEDDSELEDDGNQLNRQSNNLWPPATPGYKNYCTMKHGHFGGPGGNYYLAGSDDFRIYSWKIPDIDYLRENIIEESMNFDSEQIAFVHEGKRVLPTSCFAPEFVLEAKAFEGVEKWIRCHSPFPSGNEDDVAKPFRLRRRYDLTPSMRRAIIADAAQGVSTTVELAVQVDDMRITREASERETFDDVRTLAMFDMLAKDANEDLTWKEFEVSGEDDSETESTESFMSY